MTSDRPLLPMASACSCCSPSAATADEPKSADAAPSDGAASAALLVDGMTCAHCVSSVTEELGEVEGVESVAVELVAGGTSTVTVRLARPVDRDRLRAAVAEAGYEVVSR